MSKPLKTTFFIDLALSPKTVSAALRAAGAIVEVHTDHFPPETPDTDWLPSVTEMGWVVLTKDTRINSRPLEIEAVARAGARVFILASGNLTSQQMAEIFVGVLENLKKFVQGNQAPFIAKIYRDGRVKLWRNQTQLLKLLK